jgi:transposase
MSETELFVGVDVSNARLDVAVRPSGDTLTVLHDEPGIVYRVTRLSA